jgi:hypothetical protein
VIAGVMGKVLGDLLENCVKLSVFLMYTTNPAHIRLHRSLTLTILAEEHKWLNSFRVLLDFCYFLFLELFGLLSVVRVRDWAKPPCKA